MATAGYFFDAWQAGDTDHQVTGHAPSWVANVSITEERTRELEPHEPTRAREYGAIAGSGSADAVSAEDAQAMVRSIGQSFPLGTIVGLIDSSSGRGDGWSYCFAQYRRAGDRRVLHVTGINVFEGRFGADISFDAVVAHVAEVARGLRCSKVVGDQYQAFALKSAFARYGVGFVEKTWTAPSKIESLATLRRLLREHEFVVEPGEQADLTRKELLTLREVLTANKTFSVQARRSGRGHADRASLLLLAARCVAEGDLRGAPVHVDAGPDSSPAPTFRPLRTSFQDWDFAKPVEDQRPRANVPAPTSLLYRTFRGRWGT
jgi:hypothetical protein